MSRRLALAGQNATRTVTKQGPESLTVKSLISRTLPKPRRVPPCYFATVLTPHSPVGLSLPTHSYHDKMSNGGYTACRAFDSDMPVLRFCLICNAPAALLGFANASQGSMRASARCIDSSVDPRKRQCRVYMSLLNIPAKRCLPIVHCISTALRARDPIVPSTHRATPLQLPLNAISVSAPIDISLWLILILISLSFVGDAFATQVWRDDRSGQYVRHLCKHHS